MGRPIKKINFSDGSNPDKLGILLTAKLPGVAHGTGYAIRQKGTRAYLVTIGSETGIVRLVNKTEADELADGEAFILAGTVETGFFPVTKLTQHRMIINGAESNVASVLFTPSTVAEGAAPVIVEQPDVVLPDPVIPPVLYPPETEAVYVYNTGINPLFLTGTGNLVVGTGIPGTTRYAVAKTNFIELALTSYRRGAWSTGTTLVGDSTYNITYTAASHDFNVSWSIGETHPSDLKITELYDVKFIMHTHSDGSKNEADAIIWELRWDESLAKYILVPVVGGVDQPFPVVDSGMNADKTCVQNSFRHFWYKDAFVPNPGSVTRIIGSFVSELVAVRKSDNFEVARLEILSNAGV